MIRGRIRIVRDEDPADPREDFDELGVMVCFHGRYRLGDSGHGLSSDMFPGWSELDAYLKREKGAAVMLPLYLLDHSGITMSTADFNDPWDSGRVGTIYASAAAVREAYGVKRISAKTRARALALLRAEVETYDAYLRGQVYGWIREDAVEDPLRPGEQLRDENENPVFEDTGDACFGYYGLDLDASGLRADIKGFADAGYVVAEP